MNNEHIENSIATTIKNILFKTGDFDAQVLQMERYGFMRDSKFCFICIDMNSKGDSIFEDNRSEMAVIAEKLARNQRDLFISFSYKEYLILVLVDYPDEEIEPFIKDFLSLVKKALKNTTLHIGIGTNQQGIFQQDKNFEKAFSAMEMSIKRNETLSFYDKLSIYKVLYAVNDKAVLRGFYNETIQKLEEYDRENNAQLTQLLKTYLENNGSLQLVSEKLFIHRNTVTNQLKKIEKIVGYDPTDLEDKIMFFLGFYIKDIL
jgi:sugar diacid utilization regulator